MKTGYSKLQIALHWLVAALILAAFFTGDGMGQALRARIEQNLSGLDGATWHTVLGGAAFLFILIRIVVRLRTGAPEPHGSPLVQMAAHWGHRLIYALMIAAPALGAATWYGKFSGLGDVHEVVGQALILVAVGHVLIAIAHKALWNDGTLERMFRPESE